MNYRHAFHAGNFGDVVKHAALCLILEHLKLKDKPFVVLDTHAGVGTYDLAADEPNRTGEYRDGIGRIFGDSAPVASLAPYLAAVAAFNPDGVLRRYPGSPAIVRHMLRSGDYLMACELHPVDHAALAANFQGDGRVRVYPLDGYQALKAFLPPKPRRGLVLIDPPFEATDEFARLVQAVREAHRRWANGIYMVWLPIKDRREVATFYGELAMSGIPRILRAELTLRAAGAGETFDGCGLVVINPPWTLPGSFNELLPFLAARLATGDSGFVVDWLTPEPAPAAVDADAEPA